MSSDFVNEYGDNDLASQMRTILVRDCDVLSLFKGMKEFIFNKSGIIVKKMTSEILLHIAREKLLIPMLVSNVSIA